MGIEETSGYFVRLFGNTILFPIMAFMEPGESLLVTEHGIQQRGGNESCGIEPGRFCNPCQRQALRVQTLDIGNHSVIVRIFARKDGAVRGSRDGDMGICVHVLEVTPGHCIEKRCADIRRPVASEMVLPACIHRDQDEVSACIVSPFSAPLKFLQDDCCRFGSRIFGFDKKIARVDHGIAGR